jgi:hypothetical protein
LGASEALQCRASTVSGLSLSGHKPLRRKGSKYYAVEANNIYISFLRNSADYFIVEISPPHQLLAEAAGSEVRHGG